MKKKILITGASGFIGSFLVEEAIHQGFDVYAGIRKTSSKIFLDQEGVSVLELDLSSVDELTIQLSEFRQLHGNFDYVVHNAGITKAPKKKDFFTVNFEYTKNLIDAIISSGMKLEKFSLISSLASFGPGDKYTFLPLQLLDLQQPLSDYGKSKLHAEQYLKSISEFPYLIIAPTAVYGPRDKDFLQLVKLINKGFEFYIGTGKQMISMVYVKDLARAVIKLLSIPEVNRSYIVSDGIHYHKEQLGNTIKEIMRKKAIKIKFPLAPFRLTVYVIEKTYKLFGRRPFLDLQKVDEISSANWTCDSKDVWCDLTTSPEYFLEEGMKETVTWYKENKWL